MYFVLFILFIKYNEQILHLEVLQVSIIDLSSSSPPYDIVFVILRT